MKSYDVLILRANDREDFISKVFGGWCIAEQRPEIFTEGVKVIHHKNGNYYMITEDGKPIDKVHNFEASTCFFSKNEVKKCMSFVTK